MLGVGPARKLELAPARPQPLIAASACGSARFCQSPLHPLHRCTGIKPPNGASARLPPSPGPVARSSGMGHPSPLRARHRRTLPTGATSEGRARRGGGPAAAIPIRRQIGGRGRGGGGFAAGDAWRARFGERASKRPANRPPPALARPHGAVQRRGQPAVLPSVLSGGVAHGQCWSVLVARCMR
jgi:hypothetical protein